MNRFEKFRQDIENWHDRPTTRSSLSRDAFCGFDSLPISVFREAVLNDISPERLASLLEKLDIVLDSCSWRDNLIQQQARAVTQACIAACKDLEEKLRNEAFAKAVSCLSVAMPKLSATVLDDGFTVADEWQQMRLREFHRQNSDRLGAAVATIDLIRNLQDSEALPNKNHTVETPVLFRLGESDDAEGFVGILRVELLHDKLSCITPDMFVLGANVIHSTDSSKSDSLHESVLRIWKLAGLENCRARWSVRPFASDDEKTECPLKLEYLTGKSMEAALLTALWAANGGIPGDDYRSSTAFQMEPVVAVTGMVTDKKGPEPGSFEIDAVYGIRSKLIAAKTANIDSVVLANRRKETGAPKDLEEYRNQLDREAALYKEIEDKNDKLQRERAEAGNSEQIYSLRVVRRSTAREVFDSLLVRNRWLAKWQDESRNNWLKRWEGGRTESNPHGARAPGDDAPGPDDANLPKTDTSNTSTATADDNSEENGE